MKVVGISSLKQIYNPGGTMPLSVTVQWGMADTGGVISIFRRAEGESYWQLIGSVDVGSPGLGIPNILKSGKNETITISVSAPEESGYYQIGAREQGESQISSTGALQIQVVPATPGAESGVGVVHVLLSRDGPDDMLLYVDNSPRIRLPVSGAYITVPAGVHSLRVEGTGYNTPFDVQVAVESGKTQTVTLPLVAKSSTVIEDWSKVAVVVGAVAGVGVLYLMLRRGK